MNFKEKCKAFLCTVVSLVIVAVSVYCVSQRASQFFSVSDATAMMAAYSVMPSGNVYKKENSISVYQKPKSEASDTSTKNKQEQVQSNENKSGNKYPVSEIYLSQGNISFDNFSVRNTTDYSLDIQTLLNEKTGFEINDTRQVQVLIVHTHTCESYMESDDSYYYESFYPRTTNNEENVCAVGEQIAKKLKENGIGAVHATQQHDSPSYDGAYGRSYDTIMRYMEKYKNIKVVLDIHRDSMTQDDNTKLRPVFEYNGKKGAQIMIMSGYDPYETEFPTWKQNLVFALKLQQKCEQLYPGMTRPLSFGNFTYNMNVNSGSLLIEVGTDANSLSQAVYSGELLGNALSEVLQNC